jgi:peptidoglycan/LPS O-acetylase OafA/YrhL
MYLHRIVRLTPVLAVAVLFYMTLFPRLDSGPLWQQFSGSYQLCSDTWWATLLFVQNYAAAGRMVSDSPRSSRTIAIAPLGVWWKQ